MPEQHRPRRGVHPYMLSHATRDGSLVEARCYGCSPSRWYMPEDLMRLYGDIPTVNLEGIMRCGKCGLNLSVKVTLPPAEERQKLRLRRLDKVWWVRRVSWREE